MATGAVVLTVIDESEATGSACARSDLAKAVCQREFGVGNEEFLIVDHQKTVDFFDQNLNAVERAVDVFDAFEEKWRGDDRCCGNAEASCDACDDRCATGADPSAETGK